MKKRRKDDGIHEEKRKIKIKFKMRKENKRK